MNIGPVRQGQTSALRILLLADTHLGFDLPVRPRVERRRRGHDFAANFQRALEPALRGEVDLVVHGGDLFDRSRVPAALVDIALAPLVRVAESGTPVYLVPGNHERARIPLHLWSAHPNIHIFDRPRAFLHSGRHGTVALVGFPFARRIRDRFDDLLHQASAAVSPADRRLLCLHQTVEGAQVGPGDYTFRSGPDIIPGQALPAGFDAVLSGHIHRRQVLTHDLSRRVIAAPVVYPGSIERTSFAERDEEKGYTIVTIQPPGSDAPLQVVFEPLPVRPMVSLVLEPAAADRGAVVNLLVSHLRALDPDAVVRVQFRGPNADASVNTLSAACLRRLAPPTMNVDLARPVFNRPRQSRAFRV
jgi:DNA repair exonuclease SbcCD nuclease subunit